MQFINPTHTSFLWQQFHDSFLKNCEKLAISESWLDSEELEEKAVEITTYFFYFLEKEQLQEYHTRTDWRDDLR